MSSYRHMATPPPDAKYPDTIAITFDETNSKLTSVYNDHSVYVWDVFNIQRVSFVEDMCRRQLYLISFSGWQVVFVLIPLSLHLGSRDGAT